MVDTGRRVSCFFEVFIWYYKMRAETSTEKKKKGTVLMGNGRVIPKLLLKGWW